MDLGDFWIWSIQKTNNIISEYLRDKFMKCKGCEKDLAEGEYKQVAQWTFCHDCFEKLMSSKNKESEEQKPEIKECRISTSFSMGPKEEEEEKVELPSLSCRGCGKEMEEGEYKSLGFWKYCPECYKNMSTAQEAARKEKSEEPQASPTEEPKYTPGGFSGKYCEGCNKKLREGAYRNVSGMPFCPDCYYMLLELAEDSDKKQRQEKMQQIKAQGVTYQKDPGKTKSCQTCGREFSPESLKMVEGFEICQACLASDIDTSVQIAKERHRQYLQQLRQQLGK